MLNKIELPIANYLVIGSYPLGIRYSKDIDVICYKNDIQVEYTIIDEHVATFKYNNKDIECLLADNQESLKIFLKDFSETTYELLYIIKAGHIMYPHREWNKHILDYHILSKIVDTTDPKIKEYVKLHRKTTKERLSNIKTPKLKGVTKTDFFDDAVKKYYDHDFIHECMAHKERPMYTYMQRDPAIVDCDVSLWETFTYEEKIFCILEESYVIALERKIIPKIKLNQPPPHIIEAFKWALMRVCTTLMSGKFRKFAIDNYFVILNKIDLKYVNKFYSKEVNYNEYLERNSLEKTEI